LVADSAYPDQLAQALDAVSAQITTANLITLRDRVEGDEKAPGDTGRQGLADAKRPL